ncbi:GNAT family N-acetyltransferase [Candidatus Micrarchaeota archaeon]|nr:GNAT family N-acetyltransferase [Candidatus Micrarchaeota archaeon]
MNGNDIKLKNGKIANVTFLNKNDNTKELLTFINSMIAEQVHIIYDKKFTIEEERKWKKKRLELQKKKCGIELVARINGNIVGTTTAQKGKYKERGNVVLGIAISKEFRGIGLGKELLSLNIQIVKKLFKPKNIYLSVFANNKPA